MSGWSTEVDASARALIAVVVDGGPGRLRAWQTLMTQIAPAIESWARGSRLLRRCRLAGDDDARAVMVDVLERLVANDHANLRAFVAREESILDDDDELMREVERLGRLDDEPAVVDVDEATGTPVRAWLLRLTDYAARDHVRRRFGWGAGGATKRDLHTDATPLDGAPEPAARPPLTDRLSVSKLVGDVLAYMATFPEAMRAAVLLWLDDQSFDEIAAELALADADKARALVRAGQARLRERFRGQAPLFTG